MFDPKKFIHQSRIVFAKARDQTRLALHPADATDEVQHLFASQLDFYSQRCFAIFKLLESGLFWDAEIIFRSACEAGIKVLFISIVPEGERKKRVQEFHELSEVEQFRFRDRASKGVLRAEKTDAMFTTLAMSDEEHDAHNRRWPKQRRKALEQKWAVAEMVRELQSAVSSGSRTHLTSLMHSYDIASHFLHADRFALDLTADRESRAPEVKNILECLHFCEMQTRSITLMLSLIKHVAMARGQTVDLSECVELLMPLIEIGEKFRDDLFEAERDLYP